jgi:very-short-patch-repair endonuclease
VIDPTARARLERWKLSLLDLSAANRMLDVKDGKTTIPLPAVDPLWIAAALAEGAAFSVASDPAVGGTADAGDAGTLRSPLAAPELAQRLVAIRRAARAELADGGVHTLWLGLGLLTWCDAAPGAASGERVLRTAPLALWPVELERADGGALRLVEAAGLEPRCNLTLAEKLRRDEGVVLTPSGDELDLAALLDAADAIAATRPGWRLARSAQLGIFAFGKFVMWNDLDARADELVASPIVAHLAHGAGVAFAQPSPAAERAVTAGSGVTGGAAPMELLAPLDADARQLAAIAAAGAGASFVLQGPPGTGKSQTIANLIVHCVAHGKTVLFVTDKRAALEVVQHRLAAVGLGEFCLELHSHKAVRAQVVAQLGRVLERAFRPVTGPTGDDTRLGELRAALDGHVAALHRVGPFGRSLHDVLGRLVELRTTPRALLAERDATGLDRQTFERRKRAVHELAAAAIPVEPVATHPWRTSTMARWPLDGHDRAVAALDEAAAAAAALAQAVQDVASLLPGLVARTRDQLESLGALAALAAASPRPGAELLTQLRIARDDDTSERIALIRARGTGTLEAPRDPGSFLALASRHRLLATEVNDRFTDSVAELDAHALWVQLRRWVHRIAPLRFMALRQARAAIRAAAMPGMLETDGAMITALESVIAERAARAALVAAAEPARRWFGELGGDPLALDLKKIDAAVGWAAELRRACDAVSVAHGEAGRAAAWRALVAQVAANPAPDEKDAPGAPGTGELAPFSRLADAAARWLPALAALADATGIDAVTLGAGDDHLAALGERIETLRCAQGAMRDWVAFHGARRAAQAAGLGPAVTAIERGDLGADELAPAWERATLLAWADAELAETPALARFHGAAHQAHVAAFADLDRAALALVRARALVRLAERVPRVTADPGGELGTLLHELKKQRGHRPLRRLFGEIPTLLPRLAPCLLMSPLSVAQYLDPALPRFDVVVFDEASQLPTAEAIGALARGDAAVVVGDSRQLPPTRFFRSGDAAEPAEAADEGAITELESVLDDCVAARLPELRLSWHYRSRHEDLIAFANQRYYGDRLQVFPAAHRSPDLGVAWRRVDGVYDRGGTRQNRVEAEAVAAEVLARLRDPAQRTRSIGVVAFSRAQQELIEDLLDAARAAEPELDGWFEASVPGSSEPVLVKNLETIQGDERDVVIISVGYGPDAGGVFTMNLGPLSQRGGERRLNVAITRAREQLLVVSSFAPEDLAPHGGQGVQDLGALLAFARAGGGAARPARTDPAHAADEAPPASPITAAIARTLVERGWTVRHQVGCGAYKIDLAIVDPNDADRYVLAIEHDGAAYASAPSARDRDRLRAQVLAQLGWRMHRIWALDWWADPEREIQRAHGAIITAVAASRQRRTTPGSIDSGPPRSRQRTTGRVAPAATASAGTASAPARLPPRGRPAAAPVMAAGSGPTDAVTSLPGAPAARVASGSAPVRIAKNAIAIGPYLAAAIPAGRRAPDDLFAPRHSGELGKIIEQVLAAEAPMHVDLLARRVAAYFGIGRLTQRVTDQVRIALADRGRWGDEDHVVWRLDQDPDAVPAVRVAGHGASARREIEEVPLAEVAAAARIVVERAVAIAANDLVRDAARLLGFARVTERVIDRVASGVRLAARRELIRIDAGKATLPE